MLKLPRIPIQDDQSAALQSLQVRMALFRQIQYMKVAWRKGHTQVSKDLGFEAWERITFSFLLWLVLLMKMMQ
jgi:hypothetical protein